MFYPSPPPPHSNVKIPEVRPQVWWSQVNQRSLERIKDVREDVEPGTLQLSPLSRNMSGEYVCLARNSVGTAEANIILSVNCE